MNGKLYIVATPIGNLEDITERAKNILAQADVIIAEDTRNTLKLLNRLGISKVLMSYHKFNETQQCGNIIALLLDGKDVAMVSDAGTPCISDPGSILVKVAAERGIDIVGVSGACAIITGLSISGFVDLPFAFYGFLPRKKQEIIENIEQVRRNGVSVAVFFESPLRIKKTMSILTELLPTVNVCLCNDLTKVYEKIYRGTPISVLHDLIENPYSEKGEYTLIIHLEKKEKESAEVISNLSFEAMIVDYIMKNDCTKKEAISALAKSGINRNKLYESSLRLTDYFLR